MEQIVRLDELLDIAKYEAVRGEVRGRVMALKELRRVFVGNHFNFLFENHATVLYQIQEMMRVERIVDEKAIRHELETYNALIPIEGGLFATLMLEYADAGERAVHLPKLLGIENHVSLTVGDLEPLRAVFNAAQIGEARISSVQYLRFPLAEAQRAGWLEAARQGSLKLTVDHPHYSAETVLSPAVAQALAEDFS